MSSIKGTKTEQNLLKAFAGESQARTRYTFFCQRSKKEGYEQISAIFMETAEQEKEHAKSSLNFSRWYGRNHSLLPCRRNRNNR